MLGTQSSYVWVLAAQSSYLSSVLINVGAEAKYSPVWVLGDLYSTSGCLDSVSLSVSEYWVF